MEKLNHDLFNDPAIETQKSEIAGNCSGAKGLSLTLTNATFPQDRDVDCLK